MSYRENREDRAVRRILRDVANRGGRRAADANEILRDIDGRDIRLDDLGRIREVCGMPISDILKVGSGADPEGAEDEEKEVAVDGQGV